MRVKYGHANGVGTQVSLRPRPHYIGGFENGVFTLKTIQMFFVHTRQEEFENSTITGGSNA